MSKYFSWKLFLLILSLIHTKMLVMYFQFFFVCILEEFHKICFYHRLFSRFFLLRKSYVLIFATTKKESMTAFLNLLVIKNFVKSMTSCLSKLKVTHNFCFAFKIHDAVTATNSMIMCLHLLKLYFYRPKMHS